MKNLHQEDLRSRIWSSAEKDPERTILFDARRAWTWGDLLATAQQYAAAIGEIARSRDAEFGPVLVERSGASVAAILGVLMSNRGYAPLSTAQPTTRIRSCLDTLGAGFVVAATPSEHLAELGSVGVDVLGPFEPTSASQLPARPAPVEESAALYVLFTSGSTGVPKGVAADYGNILNTILWGEEILDWAPDDVTGCATSLSFDISQFDLFTSLCRNVPLAIYSEAADVSRVLDETARFSVTSVFSVPAFFSQFVRHQSVADPRLESLRRILSGGDFFPPSHLLEWMDERPDCSVYNVWGPTETSIVNTMHLVTDDDREQLSRGESPPVGRAAPRMPFVLLDEEGEVVRTPGVRGEICMLGQCVTLGYLKNPEETARGYFEHGGERAFRTGDLGYTDESDNLYVIGRIGSTVKLAGYRVDLGEVEKNATSLPEVHLAGAFVVSIDVGIKELWLAVEAREPEAQLDIYGIKKGLRARLPGYMVPKRILVMDELPRSQNGKVDRRELAELAVHEQSPPTSR